MTASETRPEMTKQFRETLSTEAQERVKAVTDAFNRGEDKYRVEVLGQKPLLPASSRPTAPREEPRACCAHLKVSYRTEQFEADIEATDVMPGGRHMLTRGWWECDSNCGAKFLPTAASPLPEEPPVTSELLGTPKLGVDHQGYFDELQELSAQVASLESQLEQTKRMSECPKCGWKSDE